VKRLSFASSHLTAPGALRPTLRLGGTVLMEGESKYQMPARTTAVDLVLSELVVERKAVLTQCALGDDSTLAVVVDLECSGFDLRTTLHHEVLNPKRRVTTLSDLQIASVPEPIVSEGFTLKVGLIAVDPVRTSPVGCATRGGILSSWETRIPPLNMTRTFPIEESADEPSLWRLDLEVDEPDDLDRPTRAALRLYVDSGRLGSLFGTDADETTQEQAIAWIRAEAFTSIVTHVLTVQSLREHFAGLLSRNPDAHQELDPRSVGYTLLVLLMRTIGSDLDEWHDRLVGDPVGTNRDIRARIGASERTSGTPRPKGSVRR